MELQQMRYVVAVAETRNFTRAAEQCHVVQSALSHQVKVLERELGVQLFARTSRRVELTSAGEAFLPAARASLAAADRAAADAAATAGEVRGTVTLGIIPTVTAVDVADVVAQFHSSYPAVHIALRNGGSDELMGALTTGAIDIAILGLSDQVVLAGLHTRELRKEKLVAVVSTSHRLATRRRLRLADLAQETFVDFPAHTPGRAQSDSAFATAGIRREVTFELMGTTLMLDLVGRNLAVALLPPSFLKPDPRLAAIPLADGPTRIEYLAWSDFNPTPAVREFLALLQ